MERLKRNAVKIARRVFGKGETCNYSPPFDVEKNPCSFHST